MATISFFKPMSPANHRPAGASKTHSVLAFSSPPRTTVHKNMFLGQQWKLVINQQDRSRALQPKAAKRPAVFCRSTAQTEPNGHHESSSAAAETVDSLYDAINGKNYRKVEELVADDCYLQDLQFTTPFQGKKEVVRFLRELGESIGNNVKLVIVDKHISGSSIVILAWHLEWRGKYIPFTRAWSFYECEITSNNEQRIKTVRVVMEWPIKPGDLALKLLKAVISIFDKFPEATERFLQHPYAPIAWLLRIYDTFIKPVVWPVLSKIIAYYTKLWNIMLHLATYLYVLLMKLFHS